MKHRFQRCLGAGQMKRLGAALAAVLLATLLSACNDRSFAPVERAAFVRIDIVQPRDGQASLTLTGDVEPRFRADLSFRVSGRVLARLADVGAHVDAGEVLARLDPAEQQADFDAATAGVAAAESQLRVAQATFDRQSHLLSSGFTTRVAYDQAQEQLRTAQSTLELAKSQLGKAREALGDTELHARAAGVITARNLEVGQVVQAAQSVFTLAQDGERDAVFDVPESMFLGDMEGGRVSLALVSGPDVTAVGYVREISPAVDPKSSTVRVKVAIQNPPPAMTLGSAIAGTAGTKPATEITVAVDRADGNGVKARGLDRRPPDKDSVAEVGDCRRLRSGSGADQGRARGWRPRRCRRRQAAELRPVRDIWRGSIMKTRFFVVASTIASALAMAGCKQEAKAPEPVRPVLSTVLQPAASGSTVAVGTVQPRYETNLGFRVLGRLIARPVNVGDLVAEGQTIAAIDPTALELAVRSARADLSKAQALLENAIGTEERKRILIKTDATTKQTLDDAEQVRAGAQASTARARANQTKAIEQLGYAQVKADFAGVVTAVSAEVGQVVSPGQSVVTIARPDVREAVVDIGADFPVPLTVGLPFTVSLQLLPAVQVQGQIREIAPQADSVTRMRRVRIALNDPPESFRLGSTITARLSNGHSSVLRVPASAVLKEGAETFVWVIDAPTSTVSLHKVDLSEDEGGIRVTGGLTVGARIVTAGIHSLKQGQQVRIEQDATP